MDGTANGGRSWGRVESQHRPHDSSKSPDERLEAGSVERIQPGLKNTSGKENGLVVSDLLVVREK